MVVNQLRILQLIPFNQFYLQFHQLIFHVAGDSELLLFLVWGLRMAHQVKPVLIFRGQGQFPVQLVIQ